MLSIVWSDLAKQDILQITKYWDERNDSKAYSQKIKFHTEIALNLLKRNPRSGILTNKENVRMRSILKHYYLIYELSDKEIAVLRFWDVRQNPLKIVFLPM